MSWMWNRNLSCWHTRLHGVTNWLLSCKAGQFLSKGCDWLFGKCPSSVVHHSISLAEMRLNMLNQFKPNECQCIDLVTCQFMLIGSLGGLACAFHMHHTIHNKLWTETNGTSMDGFIGLSPEMVALPRPPFASEMKSSFRGKPPSNIQPLLTSIIELKALCFTKQQHTVWGLPSRL